MNARFELIKDGTDRVRFRLLGTEGELLLAGLPCRGKIAAQNEVVHARRSITAGDHFVPHTDKNGKHFVVLKDDDGTVLGRSRVVAREDDLSMLIERIVEYAESANIVDHTQTRGRAG